MSQRNSPLNLPLPLIRLKLFAALREKWAQGYTFSDLRADLMAGLVVGTIAVPLGLGLAIACGVAPQFGLYTVIIGGALIALLGGSRYQVSGPTAAFVVVLAPIVQEFGLGGLLLAGLLAGFILIGMGLTHMGRWIQYIPYPVTTGFTSGIAVVIAGLQLKDFFGLQFEMALWREHFFSDHFFTSLQIGSFITPTEAVVGILTLIFLLLWPKFHPKLPAPLAVLTLVAFGCFIAQVFFTDLEIATIGNRFTFDLNGKIGFGIPQTLPTIHWPWNFTGADGRPFLFSLETIRAILPASFTIAMLGAIESLLSAVVADGMTQTKHDPDSELIALGLGNIICPFFGGVPATGAIARTATNIRYGARSPLASVFHALFALLVVLVFAPLMAYLPMASLAALLILVAYNMSEWRHFSHIVKVAPRSDVLILLTCFSLTIIFDMVIGVAVGVVLAALLFMRRMAELTSGHKVQLTAAQTSHLDTSLDISKDTLIYEIEGPLFFGAAEKAAKTLIDITDHKVNKVIFLMNNVPIIDMTGLVAFESTLKKLCNGQRKIFLVELRSQPKKLIAKSHVLQECKDISFYQDIKEALSSVRKTTLL